MLKLVIVLCTVGLVTSAKFWKTPFETAQLKALKEIDATILDFENRFEVIHKENEEKNRNLSRQAIGINDNLTAEQREVIGEISDLLTKESENLSLSDDVMEKCNTYFVHLMTTTLALRASTKTCLESKLKIGHDYIANIAKHFKSEIMRLTEIRRDIRDCSDNKRETTTALECISAAEFKVTAIVARFNTILLHEIINLDFILATLDLLVMDCVEKNGLVTFRNEAPTVVENTQKCFQEKINEDHGDIVFE